MAKTNLRKTTPAPKTHEGATAARINHKQALTRSLMNCMLWEDGFYEDGQTIAARIADLVARVPADFAAEAAIKARYEMKLRHAPLLVVREMARIQGHKDLVAKTLARVIGRVDEITEFLSIYWSTNGGKRTLSAQVKKGLAAAFRKFDEYALAKYDRDAGVKLRDALFLSHAKPVDAKGRHTKTERKAGVTAPTDGAILFEKIVKRTLTTPDTWEVALSGGADKRATFERLMTEGQLGGLAFLRNLRNMKEAGVSKTAVSAYAERVDLSRVLPFRFISAANAVPEWEDVIEKAMFRALAGMEKFPGATRLLIDGSASMDEKVSAKSDITRRDAACALAILLRELCDDVQVIGFSSQPWVVAPRRGFALRDAIRSKVIPESTMLGRAVAFAQKDGPADRLIVITDEQSHDRPEDPKGTGYVINVASNRNGIGYGPWVHIDGWSEAVIDYIRAYEREEHAVMA